MFHLTTSPLRRFYAFVFRRLIGKFLSKNLDANQLDIQLTQGTIQLQNLSFDCNLLNSLLKDLPFSIISADLEKLNINIPYTDLWNASCTLTIDGLVIKMRPLIDIFNENEEQKQKQRKHSSHTTDDGIHGRNWLYELASTLSIDDINESELHEYILMYKGLRKVFTNESNIIPNENNIKQSNINHPTVIEDDINHDMLGMQLISKLVEQIIRNLRIEIANTSIIIIHQSPFDKNCDSILRISLRELSIANPMADDIIHDCNLTDVSCDILRKRVQFSGLMIQLFHTSLSSSLLFNSKQNNVIICGETEENGKTSYFDIQMPFENKNGKIEIEGFIRSLRAVLNPMQVVLLLDLCRSISASSSLLSHMERLNNNDSTAQSSSSILDFNLKIHETIVVLLENVNDSPPNDWYLSHSHLNTRSYSPLGSNCKQTNDKYLKLSAVYPLIPEILSAHLTLQLQNILIKVNNIPLKSVTNVEIGSIQMNEYLPSTFYGSEIAVQLNVKPRQVIQRSILNMNVYERGEFWLPDIICSITSVFQKCDNIRVVIQPLEIDLDFELLSRLYLIAKAFNFVSEVQYLMYFPSIEKVSVEEKEETDDENEIFYDLSSSASSSSFSEEIEEKTNDEQKIEELIEILISKINLRFSVADDNNHGIPSKENIIFEFRNLIACTANSSSTINYDLWNIDCKILKAFLTNEKREKILILNTMSTLESIPNLKIYINKISSSVISSVVNEQNISCHLENARFRWWETSENIKEIKFQKGDKIATTHAFEINARRLAPTHVSITLPQANVAFSKSVEFSF